MKNNPLSIAVGFALLLIFLMLMFVYQVRTTEVVVVTTFGKPTDQKTEPGAYWRWWPIHQIYKLDKRIRSIEPPMQQSTTLDAYSILVTTYAGWAVENATDFFPKFSRGSTAAAESKLKEMLLNAQKQVVGRHELTALINLDPKQLKFDQIEDEILKLVREQCRAQAYGIDVKFVRIKRLALPEGNTVAVLDRMAAERRSVAGQIQSKGIAEANEIRANAERQARLKTDSANADAQSIIAVGENQAATLLAEFEKNPELAKFLLDVGTLESILKSRTTVIMDGNSPLIEYLQRRSTKPSKP